MSDVCNPKADSIPNLVQPQVRVALYARVSSEQQVQAGTIASQLAALRQRIAQDALSVPDELCFIDDGCSGATLLRPALERLRDTAAAGLIDRLYLLCPDRLARSFAHQMLLIDELTRCGVELVFLNHAVGSSPEDQLLLQVQGVIAEYERCKIAERCRRGRLHAARSGNIAVLGKAPYGYRYLGKAQAGGQARYDVYLPEADVVRQIFQWVAVERVSLRQVQKRLKEQGIRSPRGHDRWDASTLLGLLRNPAYKGQAAFGKTRNLAPCSAPKLRRGQFKVPKYPRGRSDVEPDQWINIPVPAIVGQDLFAAVAEQLQENRQRCRVRRAGARYLLAGLLTCKQCRYALCGRCIKEGKAVHHYYRCCGSDPHRFGGQRLCPATRIRADLLEDAVWADVCDLLKDPERLAQEYQRRLDNEQGDPTDRQQLQASLGKTRLGIERLIDAYEQGLLEKEQFESRIKIARQRLAELQKQQQTQDQQLQEQRDLRLVIETVQSFANQVASALDRQDWPMRRQLLRTLVKVIEIDDDDIHVIYRVPARPFDPAPQRGSLQYCGVRFGGAKGALSQVAGIIQPKSARSLTSKTPSSQQAHTFILAPADQSPTPSPPHLLERPNPPELCHPVSPVPSYTSLPSLPC